MYLSLRNSVSLFNVTLNVFNMSSNPKTANLQIDYSDLINTFVIPTVCFFGMITSLINIIVFQMKNMNDVTYRYLTTNSICNFFYLTHCFFIFLPRCGMYCSFAFTIVPQYFLYLFYNYIKGIFAISSIIIQIIVSLYRYFLIINRSFYAEILSKKFYLIIAFIFSFSTIFYLPNLLVKDFKTSSSSLNLTKNSTILMLSYSVVTNNFGKSDTGKSLLTMVQVVRAFVGLIILILVNIMSLIEFKKHTKKKLKLIASNNSVGSGLSNLF